ncbi:MAG: MFS transporter, partial [Sphingomonas sp.]
VSIAAALYMVGSIWDGVIDLVVGVLADRVAVGPGYRGYVLFGAAPLGLCFVLLYLPPLGGALGLALIVVAHLAFRTLYALVNVPYAALTARITSDSRDRGSIAGLRMLFGTMAAVIVSLSTQPLAATIGGGRDSATGYFGVALLLGAAATAILIPVGRAVEEVVPAQRSLAWRDIGRAAVGLAGNRAFVTLSLAIVFTILGMTMLDKTVLYYFKYVVHDAAAGRAALAYMSVAGGMSVPVWMLVGRHYGARVTWLASAAMAVIAGAAYALPGLTGAAATQAMLAAMQAAVMGMNYAFWALLPDTIDYGEHRGGMRIEATTYGLAALVQKMAIGLAAGLFGVGFDLIGYHANAAQGAATLAGMRWILILAPVVGLGVSGLCIALNPLRRDTHARILADLGRRRSEG